MTGRRPGDPKELIGNGDVPKIGAPRPLGKHDQPAQAQDLAGLLPTAGMLLQKIFSRAGGKGQPFVQITTRERKRRGGIAFDTDSSFAVWPFKDGSDWKVHIKNGFILHTDTGADYDPIDTYLEVEMEEAGYTVTDGDQIYVYYETDKRGKPRDDPAPSITIMPSEATSVHYIPDTDEELGDDGQYYKKLAKVSIVGGKISIQSVHRGCPILANNVINEVEFVGEGRKIIKEWDPDAGRWIYHKINHGPLEQILVEDASGGEGIEIKGNGFIGGFSDATKSSALFIDGICVAASGTAAPGRTIDFSVFLTYTSDSDPTGYQWWFTLRFEDGLLIDIAANEGNIPVDAVFEDHIISGATGSVHITVHNDEP